MVERGIAQVKQSFNSFGQDLRQIKKDFDNVGKGLATTIKNLKDAYKAGGLDGLRKQLKTSVGNLKTYLPLMLRGSLMGMITWITSEIEKVISATFKAYPKALASQLKGLANTVKAITGFDQFFSAGGVVQGSIALANYTKQLKAEAAQTDMSISSTMSYKLAMEMVGVEADNLGKRVSYLGKQLTKAFAGTAPDAMRVLKELGITEQSIARLDTEERFQLVAKAIEGLSDPAKRAHASMLLFERAGNQMLPLFKNLDENITNAKTVLGSLPQTLEKNEKSFVKLSNAVQNLAVKRQQFFAGFLEAAQEPFNSLLDNLLNTDFTNYGKNLAANFTRSLEAVKTGDFTGFIESFSLEFGNAFEKGFNLFMDKIDTLDFTPFVEKFAEVGVKVLNSLTAKAADVGWGLIGDFFRPSDSGIKSFLQGATVFPVLYQWLDMFYADNEKNLTPTMLNVFSEEDLKKIEEYQKRLAEARAILEAEEVDQTAISNEINKYLKAEYLKFVERTKNEITKTLFELDQIKLENTAIQGNPFATALQKQEANLSALQKEIELTRNKFVNEILSSSDKVESELTDRLSGATAETVKANINTLLDNLLKSKSLQDFQKLSEYIPTDKVTEFENALKSIQDLQIKEKIAEAALSYSQLDESIQGVNDDLEENKHLLAVLRLKDVNNDIAAAAEATSLVKRQIDLLNEQLRLLDNKMEKARENNDPNTIRETARAIRQVRMEIAQLNAQPDLKLAARFNNIMQSYEDSRDYIDRKMNKVNSDWMKADYQKWDEVNKLYTQQIKTAEIAIAELEREMKTLDKTSEEYRNTQIQVKELEKEIANLQIAQNAMGPGPNDITGQMLNSMRELRNEFGTISENIASGFANTVTSMRDSFSDFLYDVYRGAKSGKEALDEMWLSMGRTALRAITDTISNFIMQNTVMTALEYAFSATTIAINEATNSAIMAENSATADAMTAMWAPSAIMSSIATFGGAVAVGLAAMAAVMGIMGGFASGGRVRGGKQVSWLNEEGSEFVVSARSPLDNDKWLEAANRGVNLDELAAANTVYTRESNSGSFEQSGSQPQTIKQITVRTSADIREEWKRGGLIEFVRSENLRRGWA